MYGISLSTGTHQKKITKRISKTLAGRTSEEDGAQQWHFREQDNPPQLMEEQEDNLEWRLPRDQLQD